MPSVDPLPSPANEPKPSGRPTTTSPIHDPPSSGRWLAFLPCLLIFIIVGAQASPGHGDDQIYFHDELLAAGVISGFLALLWVSSKRLRVVHRLPPTPIRKPQPRGFEVLPPSVGDENRRDL